MLLKDACTLDVVCCTGDTSALDAARMMRHKHIGAVVVVDNPDEGRIPDVSHWSIRTVRWFGSRRWTIY